MLLAKGVRWHRNKKGWMVRSSVQPRLSLDETVPRPIPDRATHIYFLSDSCRSIRFRSPGPSVTRGRCRGRPTTQATQTLAQGKARVNPVNILSGNLENNYRQTKFILPIPFRAENTVRRPDSLPRALLHPPFSLG